MPPELSVPVNGAINTGFASLEVLINLTFHPASPATRAGSVAVTAPLAVET
jgi:hypothetical protein